jgi:hypothetical protein
MTAGYVRYLLLLVIIFTFASPYLTMVAYFSSKLRMSQASL